MKRHELRLHVVSLPHTQTTLAYSVCAYTEKVRKFCRMMCSIGHEVYLYAGDENEAPCDEHISCISEDERANAVKDVAHYTHAPFDARLPHWQSFNARAPRAATPPRRRAWLKIFVVRY